MSQHSEPNKTSKSSSAGGILKSSNNTTCADKSNTDKKKRVRLQWDEENLQRNETEREPRMTIAEPKTPYHLSDRSDSDSEASTDRCANWQGQETRDLRLEAAISNAGNLSEDIGYSSNSSQSTPRSRSSREEFERKRKFHYDEFRISKYFRERGELCVDQVHSHGEEEEEEERIDSEEDSVPYPCKAAIESEPVSSESEDS